MSKFELRRVSGEATLFHAHAVRRAVFIDEQDVPEEIEMDDRDDEATHVVAYAESGKPVGTARLRVVGEDAAKAERVAVHPDFRGEGLGTLLMDELEAEARERGCMRVVLHGQTTVEEFYQGLGYETVSDEFEEAGIPHVEMEKSLD